jgi:hypothetical protein
LKSQAKRNSGKASAYFCALCFIIYIFHCPVLLFALKFSPERKVKFPTCSNAEFRFVSLIRLQACMLILGVRVEF